MNTARTLLYARTISSLKPTQVLGRLWRALHSPAPDLSPAPELRLVLGKWARVARREASWLSPTRRRFLSREAEVETPGDWNATETSRLWRYHLHYFDDLSAENAAERRDWHALGIERWIEENPPGRGTGWEAHPLSLRIVNWIKWSLAGNRLSDRAVHSLAVQVRYLRRSLEHHLLGNHLFANAKALVFAGCHFRGREADAWLEKGLSLVRREIEEQVLFDGGNFERSPMYHSLMLEDLLDLVNLAGAHRNALPSPWIGQLAQWRSTARRMRRWLVLMTQPDGELALFNDCALGVAPPPDELHGYARRLGLGPVFLPGLGVHALRSSGYVRLESEDATAILDVGEIGPSYLPGHAHADTLSFELSVLGERLVVDSGTSLYDAGPERLRQRSTAAHNTVVIDEESSSEIWSSFRVARRATPHGLVIEEDAEGMRVRCSHDGYLRLPGRALHTREWRLQRGELEVRDRIDGGWRTAHARLHLHPEVAVHEPGHLSLSGGNAVACHVEGARPVLEGSTWHPRFGLSLPSACLRLELTSNEATTFLSW